MKYFLGTFMVVAFHSSLIAGPRGPDDPTQVLIQRKQRTAEDNQDAFSHAGLSSAGTSLRIARAAAQPYTGANAPTAPDLLTDLPMSVQNPLVVLSHACQHRLP